MNIGNSMNDLTEKTLAVWLCWKIAR